MWPKGFSHPFTPSFPCSHSLSLQTHSNLKPCRNEESLHVFMEDWLCVSYHKLSWLRYCDSSSFFPFHSNFNSKTLTSYPCYSGVACVVLTIVGNCKEVWEWRNWVGVAAVSKLSHSSKFETLAWRAKSLAAASLAGQHLLLLVLTFRSCTLSPTFGKSLELLMPLSLFL
jgi:hypothetical protein